MEVTSDVKQINSPQELVYSVLSHPEKLEKMKDSVPESEKERVNSVKFGPDSITVDAPGVGSVVLNIVEREEPKTIKFEANVATMSGNMWIQLLPTSETTSKMKITIKADVPIFLRAMVKKPLTEGVDKIAEMLSMLPYQAFV
ncbi:MAG: SRPBCC family protein [Bacteroidaceae bacterium]|nr:SRPBCC family protein [Bacteroidaceae bacterium]